MEKAFKGRVVLGGETTGEAVVSRFGVNLLATYQSSALKKAKEVKCGYQNNQDLYKKNFTDKIIC